MFYDIDNQNNGALLLSKKITNLFRRILTHEERSRSMNISERQADLLKIIEGLDISPTMYKNAVEKYENIAHYLETHGLEATIYPQGSFALGTVTRPYSKDKDRNYDLDFICQVNAIKGEISPKELRDKIKDILEGCELYGGRLTTYDECFTIEYANVGGVGFSIDIVPAADESYETKQRLRAESDNPELLWTAISIPRYSQQRVYNWITNNPKGYRQWFLGINMLYSIFSQNDYRQRLFENNRGIFNSVEEIPDELNRTSLQRVIQILKYHRDVYYSKVKYGDDIKPISAIINTVVARIASKADPSSSPIELLEYVIGEFSIYAKQMTQDELDFRQKYSDRSVIRKTSGKWVIENPANPEDNLADKWNQDSRIPTTFFRWVAAVKEQLIDSLQLSDESFRAKAEAAFGSSVIKRSWGSKYNAEPARTFNSGGTAKPWRTQ